MVGIPGMGKTTLTNKQKMPVIHFDKLRNDRPHGNMFEYCEQHIRALNEACVYDNAHHNIRILLDSLYRYRDYDITLVVMNISKNQWHKNILKRNNTMDRHEFTNEDIIEKFFNDFEQVKKYISITKYRKIYITDYIMDKVVNGTLIPNFEEM